MLLLFAIAAEAVEICYQSTGKNDRSIHRR